MASPTCRHCGTSLLAEGARVCPACGGADPVGAAGEDWLGGWVSASVCTIGVILIVASFFTNWF